MNGTIAAAIVGLIFPVCTGAMLLFFWTPDYGDQHRYARGEKISTNEVIVERLVRDYIPRRFRRPGFHYYIGSIQNSDKVILFDDSWLLRNSSDLSNRTLTIVYAKPHLKRAIQVGDRRLKTHQVVRIDVDGINVVDGRDPNFLAWLNQRGASSQNILVYFFVGSLIFYVFLVYFGGKWVDRQVKKIEQEKDDGNT